MSEKEVQQEVERLRAQVEELTRALEQRGVPGTGPASIDSEPESDTAEPESIDWEEALQTVETHVKEHPVGSAIAALAIGFFVGVILRR